MEIETLEIFQFIGQCDPISKLNPDWQKRLAESIEISYAKRGSVIFTPGETNEYLYMIRSGVVERVSDKDELVARFAEKDFFGHASLRRGGTIKWKLSAVEDCLLYRFPGKLFFELLETVPYFRFYFEGFLQANDAQERQAKTLAPTAEEPSGKVFTNVAVNELLSEPPQMVEHTRTVAECAKLMKDTGATSLMVTQNNELRGIVTDRAFCSKVVAENMSHESPVGLVMSENLKTVTPETTASEALLLMARHNFRHLPVLSNDKIIGVLTATDLIHRQSNNPIYLINQIYKATDQQQLERYAQQTPDALLQMVKNGLSAKDVGYSISSIGRAINRRLLQLAEKQLGEPPIEYAWIIAGSLARNDQTSKTDQDNALILSDEYDPSQHLEYFEQLSKFVCDGMNRCGYVYCPGDVMATNHTWRQPLKKWLSYFYDWITCPEPKALMHACIFFDLRCIHGDASLLKTVQQSVNKLVESQQVFLNYMAANALQFTPPLGLFRHFVLEKHGSEEKTLNLKKRGVVPIVDLARVYAIEAKAYPIATQERLIAAHDNNTLSKTGLMDLNDAFEFLSMVRIQHQARRIEKGQQPDNYLLPNELSSLERRHLKDTFEIIRTYQEAMANRFQTGRLR